MFGVEKFRGTSDDRRLSEAPSTQDLQQFSTSSALSPRKYHIRPFSHLAQTSLTQIAKLVLGTCLILSGCSTSPAPSSSSTTHVSQTSVTAPPTTSPPIAETLHRIAFFSLASGFGVFTSQVGSACQVSVGRTNDGGRHFAEVVQVSSWTCENAPPANSLAFDNQGDGFLFGPKLFVTHDGGRSWTQSIQPADVLSVEALGLSVWMIQAECPPASSTAAIPGPCRMFLLESTDGGRTWVPSPAPPPNASVTNSGSGILEQDYVDQTWLVRTGVSSGYVFANPVTNTNGLPAYAPLLYTSDGGVTWSARVVPCGLDAMTAVLSASPDGTLLVVCAGQPSAGFQAKSVTRSSNGGVTWTTRLVCLGTPQPQNCATGPLNNGYLRGLDAVSAQLAFVVGPRSPLYMTQDGGARWQAVQPPIGDGSGGTAQVIFFNASDGVVLGRDGTNNETETIWSTSDGGEQWSKIVPQILK